MKQSRGQYINGQWQSSKGSTVTSINPANDEPIWQGAYATQDALEAAYQAASDAFTTWGKLSLAQRVKYLQQFIHTVQQQLPFLIEQLAIETGKPLWEAKTELEGLAHKLKRSLEAYQARTQEHHVEQEGQTFRTRFQPLGVVAVLGAFNFPIHLSHGHIIPALLAGNTVVLKPSELTPHITECIMQCWHQSQLPRGVLNLVQGDATTASVLLTLPFAGVYFTGSYQAGLAIHDSFKTRPDVLLALEMGGNNPLIIDEVRHLDAAVYQTLLSAYLTAGQRCTCARRLFLPYTTWGDDFLKRFIQQAKQLKIGPYTETPAPFMGPVIRRSHALMHLEKQTQLLNNGGVALLPMTLMHPKGAFLSPGIIDMQAVDKPKDEEIFAPLIQVYRYQDFEDALRRANQTAYGLSAGLFSDSPDRYAAFTQQIRAGVLAWNRPTTGASSNLPFGGIGHSGNHRPSAYFAADYCVYPVASAEQPALQYPNQRLPGISS